MSISIVVPTFNGSAKISVLLEALLKQSEPDFELIVVNDGSTDNTVEVVKSYESKFGNLKIISQKNGGRSVVRNRGVNESSGEVLIFYDDDMEPAPNSIERHKLFHQQFVGIAGGNQVEEESPEKTDIQNYKAILTNTWIQKYPEGVTELEYSNLFLTAANCSVRRSVFLELNGFDERLTDAEDFDFAYRALEKGISVFFDKSNRAIHHDLITARAYIKRLRQYRAAHEKLYLLYPERKKNVMRSRNFLKRAIYYLLAWPSLVKLMDEEFFQNLLPKRIRFKFYSLVIQALAVEFPGSRL